MGTDFDETLMPDIAIPPGEMLQEELEYRGIAEEEFAQRIGVTRHDIADIFLGNKAITQDMADAIERELDISATLWIKMEARYQFVLSRLKERGSASQSIEMAEATHSSDR